MRDNEIESALKPWLHELREWIKKDPEIASQMVNGFIKLLERKSKHAAPTTENTRLKLVRNLALND